MLRVVLELLAEPPDVHPEVVDLIDVLAAPGLGQQRPVLEHVARVADEVVQQRLDQAVKTFGSISDSRPVVLGTHPGREFRAEIPGPPRGQIRGRLYLAGGRMYQVLVIGTANYVDGPAATEFLESFDVEE